MGIRFACHVCQRRLNIKRELAGRRGICPVCAARIRIPLEDCETSTPIDERPLAVASPTNRVGSSGHPRSDQPVEVPGDDASLATHHSTPAVDSAADEKSNPADPSSQADRETPDGLSDEAEATWYVRPPSGGQYGPATTELLRQWIGEGRVAATALLWREGWPQWRDASDALPEYADRMPAGGGSTVPNPAPVISSTDLPDAIDSQATESAEPATAKAMPRSKWTRAVMTIGLLSVLALSLILVLAFAVLH